jgi:hypothetical protein
MPSALKTEECKEEFRMCVACWSAVIFHQAYVLDATYRKTLWAAG